MSPGSSPQHHPVPRLLTLDASDDPMISDLAQLGQADHSFEVRFCDLSSLTKLLEEDKRSVFFSTIDGVEKLKSLVHLFKSQLRPHLRRGKIHAIALNRLNHHDVPRILTKMGFSEVISSRSIKPEGLKLRIDELFARFLPHDIGLIPMHSGDSPESGLIVRECRLQLLDPLATPSDCWLLRRSQDVRIVNDQWIIDLVGPGPTAGRWTRVSPLISQTSDGHSRWQWEPSGKNGFIKENGLWLFEGKRPHFNEFHWTFTSKAPRLTYYEQSEPVCDYFSVGPDRTLLIAANSEIAQQKWPAIQASVLNEYRYTVTAPRIATPNWKILMSEEKQVPWRELMGLESATAPSPSRQQLIHEIQAKTSPLAELFAKVEDEELRTKLILEMSKMQCSALVWTVGQKIRFGAKIRDSEKTPKSLMIEPPASLNPAELQEALQSAQSQLFVNVSLYRGGVFFVAEEVYIRDSLIEVVLPKLLYQVQRRSHFRLYVPEEKAMFIRIGDQFHRILNLSGGGAAFATGQVNSAVFTNGTMLPKVSFQIYNEKIHCKAEVRWSKPFADAPEGSELTVGLQFHNLREADEQRLNLYVLEEGFEYFRQHVLSNP